VTDVTIYRVPVGASHKVSAVSHT